MRSLFLMLLLVTASSGAIAGGWKYEKSKDEMRGTVSKIATKESINTVNFDFPYKGVQRGTLMVIDSKSVLFYVKKGQVICHDGSEYGTCSVLIKIDGGEAEHFDARKIGDDSTTIAITDDSFLAKLKVAKNVMLQVEVYQNGYPIFKFDVSGLKIDAPISMPVEKNDVQQTAPNTVTDAEPK